MILILLSLFNIALALLVIKQNVKRAVNILLSLIILCIASWSFFSYLYFNTSQESLALLFNNLMFLGPFLLPILFLYFSWVFPTYQALGRKKYIY